VNVVTTAMVFRILAAGLVSAAAVYVAIVAVTWLRYGKPPAPAAEERDLLLDTFLPEYDVAERHHVQVSAPADVTLTAATETDMQQSAVVRAIFRTRELLLGADSSRGPRTRGLLAETLSIGWGMLAEVPGREVVVGAVTQPWQGNVVFRALPPDGFRTFAEPGYVKIAWTLRADSAGSAQSIFRTETRAVATDTTARAKFRWYWARFSPGIILIRRMLLRTLKAEAEQRAVSAAR
jgi:hypothetical protein